MFCFLIEIFNPAGLGANIEHKTKKNVDLLSQTTSGSFQHFPHTVFTAEGGVAPTTLCGVRNDFSLWILVFMCFSSLHPLCELLGTPLCRLGASVFSPAWAEALGWAFVRSSHRKLLGVVFKQ